MSGGHFDFQETHLGYIADQLEQDIECNDIPYDIANAQDDERYGFQLDPKTIQFLKEVAGQLKRLKNILHEYDLAVSGDTSEKTFQELVGIK
jgi:hypothetical protein